MMRTTTTLPTRHSIGNLGRDLHGYLATERAVYVSTVAQLNPQRLTSVEVTAAHVTAQVANPCTTLSKRALAFASKFFPMTSRNQPDWRNTNLRTKPLLRIPRSGDVHVRR